MVYVANLSMLHTAISYSDIVNLFECWTKSIQILPKSCQKSVLNRLTPFSSSQNVVCRPTKLLFTISTKIWFPPKISQILDKLSILSALYSGKANFALYIEVHILNWEQIFLRFGFHFPGNFGEAGSHFVVRIRSEYQIFDT